MSGNQKDLATILQQTSVSVSLVEATLGDDLERAKPIFNSVRASISRLNENLEEGNLKSTHAARQAFREFRSALNDLISELQKPMYDGLENDLTILSSCRSGLVAFSGAVDIEDMGKGGRG